MGFTGGWGEGIRRCMSSEFILASSVTACCDKFDDESYEVFDLGIRLVLVIFSGFELVFAMY